MSLVTHKAQVSSYKHNSQDEKRMSFIYVHCVEFVWKIIILALSDWPSAIFLYYHSTRSIFEFGTRVPES